MAKPIRKTIITDPESGRPVAVQIPYEDWADIEDRLGDAGKPPYPADLSRHHGTLRLPEDPVAFQRRVRDEWS